MDPRFGTWLAIGGFGLLIAFAYFMLPTCARNEVMVRGTFGYVCVTGHN